MKIALLCNYSSTGAATVLHHIDAICSYSRHDVTKISMLGDIPPWLDLHAFDAVIIHYSLTVSSEFYLTQRAKDRLNGYPGVKCAFVQDEYRHVDNTCKALREIGINVLFTCVPEAYIESIYGERLPGVRKINVLTGYVPMEYTTYPVSPPSRRPIKVGYRGRYLPAWLGELGQEKWRIGHRFQLDASKCGIECDISFREEDRLYGQSWVDFLASCRAVLGVESGASVIDFSGDIQACVERYVAEHPDAEFEEIRDACFKYDDGIYPLNQISPRCFEAAALRTVMILYEGEYSGILQPWRHFIPLRKDHSNIDEVLQVLQDGELCDHIADNAYNEIALDPAYQWNTMVNRIDHELEKAAKKIRFCARQPSFIRKHLGKIPSPVTVRRRVELRMIEILHRFVFSRLLKSMDSASRQAIKYKIMKIAGRL